MKHALLQETCTRIRTPCTGESIPAFTSHRGDKVQQIWALENSTQSHLRNTAENRSGNITSHSVKELIGKLSYYRQWIAAISTED